MAEITLKDENTVNVDLSGTDNINVIVSTKESTINTQLPDINYIPGYKYAEEERRVNEEQRISNENERKAYYEEIQQMVENGEFDGKDGIDGQPGRDGENGQDGQDGRDGAIQYTAGTNIEITEDNVINCTGGGGGGIDEEVDPTVPSHVKSITINDITNWNNKSEFSGSYNDLTDTPNLFSGSYNDLTDKPDLFSGSYNDLTDTPNIPTKTSDLKNDSGFLTDTDYQELDREINSTSAKIGDTNSLQTQTKENLVSAINEVLGNIPEIQELTNIFYPVGSYYETSDINFNPNTVWGGTWELENDGTVLVSKSNVEGSLFNAEIGTIFGEEKHQLTISEMPRHAHNTFPRWGNTASGALYSYGSNGTGDGADYDYLSYNGGDEPHNNIQPSKIINRWHRTA